MFRTSRVFYDYQFYRNLWQIADSSDSRLLILLPRANTGLWHLLDRLLTLVTPKTCSRVSAIAIEDVIGRLASAHGEETRTPASAAHALPALIFPEIERYYHASRSEWLLELLKLFPTPAHITRLPIKEFVQRAWPVVGRKVSKQRLLEDIYRTAPSSIGLPVEDGSEAVAMFRVVLGESNPSLSVA